MKLLGFDSRSNTLSWRLSFKWSVSYPYFWTQNSFSTSQQVSCSLWIFKTLHLVRVRWSSVALQWSNASRIGASSVRSRDHRQLYVNHLIPKYQKYSTGWLSATTIKFLLKKCNCYDKVPKYCNPLAFHCQDLIGNILCCLFWAINVNQCRVRMGLSIRKGSGVHWSAPKQGDRTEELKEITATLVEWLNVYYQCDIQILRVNCIYAWMSPYL